MTRTRVRAIYHVPAEYWEPAQAGMEKELQDLGLSWAERNITVGEGLDYTAAINYPDYKKHYRGLRWWFCLIGDYQSLLMLQEHSPLRARTMKLESLILFIRYKRGHKTEFLKI